MAQARITKQPYGNLSCDLFCCTSRAPWQINSDGGPAHLAKRLCDEHARDLIRTLPDEFAAELGAAVLAKIQAGGEAAAVLLDMLRAVRGEALPGTPPNVSLVVTEVKNGTDWGSALVEALLPVLEAPADDEKTAMVQETWTKDGSYSLAAVGADGTKTELRSGEAPFVIIQPTTPPVTDGAGGTEPEAPAPPPKEADYTIREDGKLLCVCGKVCDTEANWKKHKPHCKGPKEGENDA